jgi:hypothetical protein
MLSLSLYTYVILERDPLITETQLVPRNKLIEAWRVVAPLGGGGRLVALSAGIKGPGGDRRYVSPSLPLHINCHWSVDRPVSSTPHPGIERKEKMWNLKTGCGAHPISHESNVAPSVFLSVLIDNSQPCHLALYCILSLYTKFGLVNGFVDHLQVVTTNNYNTVDISTFYTSLEHTV